jgi:class 3 adenylate cyclase
MATLRGSSVRARLTRTLVGLGLVSVLLLAAVNIVVVRGLLDRGVRDQLTTLRDMRRDSVELGIDRLLTRVAVLGSDPGVASAVSDLSAAYAELDTDLDDDELDTLTESYSDVVLPYDEAGVPRPPVPELLPTSTAGRSVQYEYIATQPAEVRADVVDAGDGSAYSAAHAEYHDFMRELAATMGASDLVLVDATTADVVYSVGKHVDLGTNVDTGPYADTGLGETWARLRNAAVTQAVISDSAYYLPSSTAPIVHVAATIRSGSAVVGAVIASVEIEVLTAIVTAEQQWGLLGLGDTGEAYLVGPDLTLRTVPRPWFEDPDGYIERYLDAGGDDRTAGLMEFTDSPVMLQSVDNEAVRTAIEGDEFLGTVDNYLGNRTLSASAPIDAGDLGWVVITEQQTSETRDELVRFAVSIGILLAILLPILAVVGIVLARVLARPVRPLVDAAGRIADGRYETDVPDLGPTELGDVGRQLEAVAAELTEQEASIASEEQRITTMLSSVLPPALVELVRNGERELGDVVDTGTVIAVAVRGLPDPSASDQDVLADLDARAAEESATLVERFGVERARVAPEQLLFVAGRGMPEYDATTAADFAAEAVAAVERIGGEVGLDLTAHIGLALGLVGSGLLGSQQVAFGVWGDCVPRAVALSRAAGAGEILADSAVVEQLDERWHAETGEVSETAGPDARRGAYSVSAVAAPAPGEAG